MFKHHKPMVSLVIPAKNEGSHIQNTIKSAFQVKTNYPFEIVVVDDASNDGCCDFLTSVEDLPQLKLIRSKGVGVARARNIGARNSLGQYLIFCDAHVFFEDFWMEGLIQPILNGLADGTTPGIADTTMPNIPGYGQTLNENLEVVWHLDKITLSPTAILPGGCFAISRDVFFDIGGFDSSFQVWGLEDIDISIKMWLFGYTCYAQPAVKILHVFRKSAPYQLSFENVHFNMLRMAYSHFNEERIDKCRKKIPYHNLSQIQASVLASGVLGQRAWYFSHRKHDDDWYMKKFSIPF